MSVLVLLRHGQSQWNRENRFTGWTDVPLTEQGRADAAKVAESLRDFRFDSAFASRLRRATDTLDVVLKVLGLTDIPVTEDSALNERDYGDLTGLNKAETAEKFGKEQVRLWRRSYATRPPGGESIEDCERRTLPFFLHYIVPELQAAKTVLVSAHGNSMRPIIKELDHLESEEASTLEIGLCTPYIYWFKGEEVAKKEVREVPGIVTKGSSITEKSVKEGRV